MYTIRQSTVMSWGKLRRAFLLAFRKKRVLEKLDRRRGACSRCGACCKIIFKCPAYDDTHGEPKCLIYNDRPGVCGLFPLDEKDLRDRDIVMPESKCGFYFDDKPNGNGNGHGSNGNPIRESMPLRWGPPKKKPDGKRNMVRGSLAILMAFFRRPNRSP